MFRLSGGMSRMDMQWKQSTLLLLNGKLPAREQLQTLAAGFRQVVAADGAGLVAVDSGLIPDVVIGDLDSVGTQRTNLEQLGVRVMERPNQEENDFEKGLSWLIEQGETSVTVLGIAGGMIDHTLNNFSILAKFAHRLQLQFLDEQSIGIIVVDSMEFPATPGLRVSLIPLPFATVTTTGLAWALANEQLAIGKREGASNVAIADRVSVTVHHGVIAVIIECDEVSVIAQYLTVVTTS